MLKRRSSILEHQNDDARNLSHFFMENAKNRKLVGWVNIVECDAVTQQLRCELHRWRADCSESGRFGDAMRYGGSLWVRRRQFPRGDVTV
jgi:hypothetical protein